jgi:hypothetical protein
MEESQKEKRNKICFLFSLLALCIFCTGNRACVDCAPLRRGNGN